MKVQQRDSRAPSRSMKIKANIIMAFILIIGFIGLDVRLVFIQIVQGDFYEKGAITQQLWDTPVYAKRGSIFDRNGDILVKSAQAYTVFISPAYIDSDAQRTLIADELSSVLEVDRDKVYELTGKKQSQYELIKRRITMEQTQEIRNFIKDNKLNSVALAEDNKRYYVYDNLASQVLGFTGADNQGLYGVELYYDSYLAGVNGRAVSARNAVGTEMPADYDTYIPAQDGNDLVLTIDQTIQHFLEKYLEKIYVDYKVHDSVTGIIMDVNTGEILAMSNKPDFNPNNPNEITDANALQTLSQITDADAKKAAESDERTRMWKNNAINYSYEPGSTFKTLVSTMVLEEGLYNLNSPFYCTGSVKVADRTIRCFKRDGHGAETFLQGLMNSCNPVFIEVSRTLGPQKFFQYFSAYGLTQKTGIDLPGEATSIYHTEKELTPVSLAVSSFGQTFKLTPIQMLTAVCAATNGGYLVQPHIVKQRLDSEGNILENYQPTVKRQVVSAKTSQTLCQMLEKVVTVGTAKNAYVPGYRVGGKTGTSEKTETKGADGSAQQVISSMLAVAPVDNPQIAMLLLADNPGVTMRSGGTVTGPAIGGILSEVLPYLGVQPVYTDEEKVGMEINTPKVTNMAVKDAVAAVEKAGLKTTVKGNGDTIITQTPAADAPLPKGGTVILYTGGDGADIKQVAVPNLIGMTPSQATLTLTRAGLNVRYKGITSGAANLTVYEQSQIPETMVAEGSVIIISIRAEARNE